MTGLPKHAACYCTAPRFFCTTVIYARPAGWESRPDTGRPTTAGVTACMTCKQGLCIMQAVVAVMRYNDARSTYDPWGHPLSVNVLAVGLLN